MPVHAFMHGLPGTNSPDKLYAREILLKSINALTQKQKSYESILKDLDFPLSKLLFYDSVSVIQDCIEIVCKVACEQGIAMP